MYFFQKYQQFYAIITLTKTGKEAFYDYKKNKGYPTKEHIEALYKYGKTKLYRQTFKPVYLIDKEIEDEI